MSAAPTIQRAGPAHCMVLAAIHEIAFPPSEAWSAAMFGAQLGLPGSVALFAAADGLIVARVAADEAEILTLAVATQARRRGLARQLVLAACAQARADGACKVFLEVSAANKAAQALYAACGFTKIGRRRRYYVDGTDALMMVLVLDPEVQGDPPLPSPMSGAEEEACNRLDP